MPADLDQRRKRRSQDQPCRWVLDGKADSDSGAQRFAEVDDARGIDVGTCEQIRAGRPRIGGQPFLGWRTRVPAIAAIVREEDLQPVAAQRRCQRHTIPAMTGVAVEDHDGEPGSRPGSGDEPRVQAQSVGGVEGDGLSAWKSDAIE